MFIKQDTMKPISVTEECRLSDIRGVTLSDKKKEEYHRLSVEALKSCARRSMEQYNRGECLTSEQAIEHFLKLR